MKTLKRAEQKNVEINLDMYSPEGLASIMKAYNCFFWLRDEETGCDNYYNSWRSYDQLCWRHWVDNNRTPVFLYLSEQVKELKVIYHRDYGFYTTMALMDDGGIVYVKL